MNDEQKKYEPPAEWTKRMPREPVNVLEAISWTSEAVHNEFPERMAAVANDAKLDEATKAAQLAELEERKQVFAYRLQHLQGLMNGSTKAAGPPDFASMTDSEFRQYRQQRGIGQGGAIMVPSPPKQ